MPDPVWFLLFGTLLVTMQLAGTLLARLLLSGAMVYLGVGYALGPGGLGLLAPDPFRDAHALERVAEVALLISLFNVGLDMGATVSDRRWLPPLRLALVTMAATVGLIAVAGVWGLGLAPGEAILLGGILAPTDPVLASGVQARRGALTRGLRFSLAGEGGLNDGTAFPFVMLGLLLLDGHGGDGAAWWHWVAIDLLWGTAGGLAIGAGFGALIGWLVVRLRTRHRQALGLDGFLSLGLVAVACGVAQLCLASGFLAAFAAGLALQRVQEQPRAGTPSLGAAPDATGHAYEVLATHPQHAGETMTGAVQDFSAKLEKLAELTLVLLVGAMLPHAAPWGALWWFVPLLFVLLRPLAVMLGLAGSATAGPLRAMIAWFGIRGIGSVFYLMFAIRHGIDPGLARKLATITLIVVAVSIVAHGISVQPLMRRYAGRLLAGPRGPPDAPA